MKLQIPVYIKLKVLLSFLRVLYAEVAGLAIYVNNKMSYKILPIGIESTCCEGFFIEISSDNMNKNIILGNLCRPPRNVNENYQSFLRNDFDS